MGEAVHYDAVVIGSGQGGTPLAGGLAESGLSTALIEAREVGGTCVNYGCTPTKTMVASARVAYVAGRASTYGVGVGADEAVIDMTRVRERKRSIVASFRGGSEKRVENAANLELIRGHARFTSAHALSVQKREGGTIEITADRIFINTGTRPAVPRIEGIDRIEPLDNESIMELDRVPEHLVVVGGGYIGVEFGQMFRRFGSRVTIVQRSSRLLPREDAEISDAVRELLESEGVEVLLGAEPVSVSASSAGGVELSVRRDANDQLVKGTHLLLASGRTPNTDSLDAVKAGVELDNRGYVRINEFLETGVKGIWALGDVKGGPEFTHISYDDYRVLMRNVVEGARQSIAERLLPYTVFTDPQLGRVGLSEEQARAAGHDIRVAAIPMSWVARALETDETAGMMKAVVDAATERILGFAMLGMQGGEIAGAVQLAMMGNLPYTTLRDGVFSHPTLMEALNTLFSSFREEA